MMLGSSTIRFQFAIGIRLAVAETVAARLISIDRPLQAAATSSRSLPIRITFPSGMTQRPVSLKRKHAQVVARYWSGCARAVLSWGGSG